MQVNFDDINQNVRNNHYPVLGTGSGRKVFDLGDGYVVKVARNRKGIAQNLVEKDISIRDRSGLFAEIKDISEGGIYLIMEKANKISDMSVVWNYFSVKSNQELAKVKLIREVHVKYNLIIGDLVRPINWGIVHEKPVVIDYGFTRAVKQRYYSFFSL